MSLTEGTRLGSYEIISPLGAGGMGAVYRARDTDLNRDVALKILPDVFATDPDRLMRFKREAQTLAAVNHPNIAHIYSIGVLDAAPSPAGAGSGVPPFLVMELVEGEDLASRLTRGPLPIDEALRIATQIANALEAAHNAGIVHRDLKPANIRLRRDGTVKVLDFGLAKPPAAALAVDSGATITSPAVTMQGVVLGTAAYMAPEQAKARVVDRRADIWAFGCVLYEMLAGHRAFGGDDVTETVVSVITREPDWSALPPSVPTDVRGVIARCLRKDAGRRFHHIADVRIELEDAEAATPVAEAGPRPSYRLWLWATAAAAIASAVTALAAWTLLHHPSAARPSYSYTINSAGFNTVSTTAISHDGKWIAYSPNVYAAPFKLLVRALDSYETRELASSTSTNLNPFFSSDDQWIAFFMEQRLYKVPISGGSPQLVSRSDISIGGNQGVWTRDGTIIITTTLVGRDGSKRVLAKVTPAGELTTIASPGPNEALLSPAVVPDGHAILYTIATPNGASIATLPLNGGTPRQLIADARTPKYVAADQLVYQRASTGELLSVGFDPAAVSISSTPTRVGSAAVVFDSAAFDVASSGTLIYSTQSDTFLQSAYTLVWVDRSGVETTAMADAGTWATPRVSPDGRSVLYREIRSPNCDLWLLDIARGTRTRLTFEGDNHDPVWRKDGFFTWASQTVGPRHLRLARADRPADVTNLANSSEDRRPESWSPDGRFLLFTETNRETGTDLWTLDTSSGETRAWAATKFQEHGASFSPDGRLVAYESDESGRDEIYIQNTARDGARQAVSTNGGMTPLWSPDGKELFYQQGAQLMAVTIDTRATPLQISRPRVAIKGSYAWDRPGNYDISRDGRRFIFVRRGEGADPSATLRLIVNWSPHTAR